MADTVSVTMYKAGDGSLHATKEAADFRDRSNLKIKLTAGVGSVIEKDFDDFAQVHVKKVGQSRSLSARNDHRKACRADRQQFQRAYEGQGLAGFQALRHGLVVD